jgi:K+-sensing histidine kinase KdpD
MALNVDMHVKPQTARGRSNRSRKNQMNTRLKKFVGTMLMVAFVAFYALLIALLAPPILRDASKSTEALFYLIAGLAWALPLMPLIRWMERKAAQKPFDTKGP